MSQVQELTNYATNRNSEYIATNIIATDSNGEMNHFEVKVFNSGDSTLHWTSSYFTGEKLYWGTKQDLFSFLDDFFLVLDSYTN